SRDDRLVGGVITFIDISRRKILEKQLQHSQRMEAIGTLTGGIAHDFNNILTVISGYVGLLQSQLSDTPKLLSKIQKIGEAAECGSKLTHGLLAYSRKTSEPSTPVDLNQLILKTQDFFGRVIGEHIQKTIILSEQSLVVLADTSQLEQILMNLVTNARDAMPDGGVLTIKTEQAEIDRGFCQMHGYGEPGKYALITVVDDGVGIPKEIQQKIFDPFFTTKDTGKGTGLGLAMAWGIVKQHKGYILVDSLPGEGTNFKIYLPLTDQPVVLTAVEVNTPLPGGDETILLVEDDPLVRESTHSILTAVGYRVVTSDCAESALEVLEQKNTNLSLILSDVVMPGLKGSEFYLEIRKKTDIPVIFMSGYTFDALHEQGLVREGVRLLNKPIQPIALLTEIRETLNIAALA
ncbi:MAG: ATP-binding protein, partial [Pseudomonadota bacterium]|nr:ATP-binding protein [Pseudomonadota bacterium]